MQVLIIDTSADAVCVAVGNAIENSTNIVLNEKSRHGENLFHTVEEALKQQSITLNDIEAIGVGIGPGSFTGLRIGIIAAHTLAHALNIPIVYMSSLELMALSKETNGAQVIYRDARRKEYYTASFSTEDSGIHEEEVDGVKVASILKRIETEHLIPYGDIELDEIKDIKPSSAIVLVQEAIKNNIVANPFAAQAIYIRKSDAELSWNIKK